MIPALGPGYAVTSQGPLQASQFASDAPDPSAAAGALSTLGKTISTYERVWQADGGLNQVQDLLVRFPDPTGAQVFLQAAQHSLESGEIVSSDPVASIPGARRVTYFAATNQDGVGEAITMRVGRLRRPAVVLLGGLGQRAADLPGQRRNGGPGPVQGDDAGSRWHEQRRRGGGRRPSKKTASGGTILAAVLVVAVLALAVATPVLLRRRRAAPDAAA